LDATKRAGQRFKFDVRIGKSHLRGVPNQPSAATLVANAATANVVNVIFMATRY
jgi:hypothetical protein